MNSSKDEQTRGTIERKAVWLSVPLNNATEQPNTNSFQCRDNPSCGT